MSNFLSAVCSCIYRLRQGLFIVINTMNSIIKKNKAKGIIFEKDWWNLNEQVGHAA